MFSDASTWVLISFLVFVGAFGKKLWVFVAAQLDEYIEKTKSHIQKAEGLKLEASELLKSAKKHKHQINQEIEKIKESAQKELDSIEASGKKSIEELSSKYDAMLAARVRDEVSRQKQKLLERAFDLVETEIVKQAKSNPESFNFSLSEKDLSEIVKKVKTNETE